MTIRGAAVSFVLISLLAWFAVGFQVLAEEGAVGGGGATSTTPTATSTEETIEEEENEDDENNATTTPEMTEEEEDNTDNIATTTQEMATTTSDTANSSDEESILSVDESIALKNGCEVIDSGGVTHVFPATSSPSEYLGICALVAAFEAGLISDFVVANHPSFGQFIESIEGISGESAFWALWKNGEFADCGIACLVLAEGDTISLIFTTFEGEESDTITLHISELEEAFKNITLLNECEVEDKNGALHAFPTTSSPSEYLTICALAAALDEGEIESYQLGEFPGFGLFVEGLNGVTAAADEFWSLFLNGAFAECGIECLPLDVGDIVSFVLTSFEGEERGAEVALHITALTEVSQEDEEAGEEESDDSDSNPGGGSSQSDSFDVPDAIAFLAAHQELSGSFGDDLFTDWVAVAFGSVSGGTAESKLKDYLRIAEPSLSSITDYERHAMALMALGINPYTGTETDYIAPIVEAFDGAQIGDSGLVNDDVFALFPLLKAGYNTDDEIIKKTAAFIVSEQNANGSWEDSVDFTAAAVQALAGVNNIAGVSETLDRAKTYLHTQQDSDSSFGGDVFSTSWAMQAIEAFGESDSAWSPSGDSPEDFLAEEQQQDGGVLRESESTEMRVWATSYAIPAVRGATWASILSSFPKPSPEESESSNSGSSGGNSSPSSDNAEETATSTATTTPQGLVLGESTTTAETIPSAFSLPTLSTNPVPTEAEDEATTSPATTSSSQVAAATESIEGWSDLWIWSLGLLFIFFSLLYAYFFRNSF